MLTKIIAEDLIQKAKHLLHRAHRVVVVSHQSPDGDALGSTLAMADFLTCQGKAVQVIYPDPFPAYLGWLSGADKAWIYSRDKEDCDRCLQEAEVILCLDFNQLKRMGALGEAVAGTTARKMMIDHHPFPDEFADVTISYPSISSTSELVFRYICRSGSFDEMSVPCAECILTGMMTDTGAFTYNANSQEIYFIVSELIKKGVNKDLLYNRLFNTWSADRMRLMGFVLNHRMKLIPELKTAVLTLSLDDLKGYDYKTGDTEGFVNLPLSIDGIVFSVFIREDSDKIKLSFRSQGSFPTNQVAADLFSGGGHLNASGGEFYGSLQEAVDRFEKALPGYAGLLG